MLTGEGELSRLTGVNVAPGQRQKALEFILRVEKMCNLAGYQRMMIDPMRYYFDTM